MFKFFATTNLNLHNNISVIQLLTLQNTHTAFVTYSTQKVVLFIASILVKSHTRDATDTKMS